MKIIKGKIDWNLDCANRPVVELLVDEVPRNQRLLYQYVPETNGYVAISQGYVDWLGGGNGYRASMTHPGFKGQTSLSRQIIRLPGPTFEWRPEFTGAGILPMPTFPVDPLHIHPVSAGGFGGRRFEIMLANGEQLKLHGPWSGCSYDVNRYLPEPVTEVRLTTKEQNYERGYTFTAAGATVALLRQALKVGLIDVGPIDRAYLNCHIRSNGDLDFVWSKAADLIPLKDGDYSICKPFPRTVRIIQDGKAETAGRTMRPVLVGETYHFNSLTAYRVWALTPDGKRLFIPKQLVKLEDWT